MHSGRRRYLGLLLAAAAAVLASPTLCAAAADAAGLVTQENSGEAGWATWAVPSGADSTPAAWAGTERGHRRITPWHPELPGRRQVLTGSPGPATSASLPAAQPQVLALGWPPPALVLVCLVLLAAGCTAGWCVRGLSRQQYRAVPSLDEGTAASFNEGPVAAFQESGAAAATAAAAAAVPKAAAVLATVASPAAAGAAPAAAVPPPEAAVGAAAEAAVAGTPVEVSGQGGSLSTSQFHAETMTTLQPGELRLTVDAHGSFIVLGEGANAVVCKAQMLSGKDVAVKIFELHAHTNFRQLWREVDLLRSCAHERVVPCLGVAVKSNLLVVAMQLMQGGSLRKAIECPRTREKLRWQAGGRQVALDVAEGLRFLHSRNVMHSDIKPSNVLLSEDLRACIADLGMAQVVDSEAGRVVLGYSPTHAAPEQLLKQHCGLAADIYSFGLLLMELTTRTVFTRRNKWRLPQTPQECPPGVVALIKECLSPDPARRPTAADVLQRLRAEGE